MTQAGSQKKEKGTGMLEIQTEKRESQSAFIVMQSTGQTGVKNMKQQRKENNNLEINKLCFNCGKKGHRENKCFSRGCFYCKAKHHSSLCEKEEKKGSVLTNYSPSPEETLPPIIPVASNDETLWAFLDTGSGRNFISTDAIKMLN